MKVPDKIYVQHAKSMSNGFVGIAWTDKNFNSEPVEYIRKDALLEWIDKLDVKQYKERRILNDQRTIQELPPKGGQPASVDD